MSSSAASDSFCLSVHAAYRCRHSGACCSSGWAIPIEVPLYRRLTDAIADGRLPQPGDGDGHGDTDGDGVIARQADAPAGIAGVLRTRGDGTCVLFDRASHLCTIHEHTSHDALPIACQQFPRVSLRDARGVFVTLSHYCPTAVDLLFDDDSGPLSIVRNPAAFPPDGFYDGLDARETYPPLLRPGVLMDWDTLDAWNRLTVSRFAGETEDVDAAVRYLHDACEHLRKWSAADGPLIERLSSWTASPPSTRRASALDWSAIVELDREVGHGVALDIETLDDQWTRQIAPVWPAFTRPLCRYVAAKLFASWCWYQGDGLRTVLRSVDAALAVLRVEAARQVRQHGRMLDRALLRESIRQADLRVVHLAAPEALARLWSVAEKDNHSHEPKG
jgi:Fe-S-cluster containining protein